MATKKKVEKFEPAFTPEEVEQIDAAQANPSLQEVGKKMVETVDKLIASITACGHINKQHYGTKGKLEDLACILEPKHSGDHSASYIKLIGEPITDAKGRITQIDYHEETAVTRWSDAAGKPTSEIRAGEIEQMTLLQKDLVMQILAKAPNLTVEQATQQAKASPEWSAAERS